MATIHSYPQFMELVGERYSCRNYDADAPLDADTVRAIVDAARLAPSATNRQPWTFVAVTDTDTRAAILAKSRPAFLNAPVILVACGHHADSWHRPTDGKDHTDVDLSIAIEHICLAAASLGVGSCWVCSFDVDATRKALGLPDDVEPVALIPLGYPADSAVPAKNRKTLDDILRWEKY